MEHGELKNEKPFGLLQMIGRHKGKMIVSGLFSIAAQGCGLVPFILIYCMVTEIAGKAPAEVDASAIWRLALAGAAATVLKYVFSGFSSVLSHTSAYNILYDLRILISKKLATLPLGWFNESTSGQIKKVMLEDVEQIEVFVGHNLPELVGSLVHMLMAVGVLFYFDWRLALAALSLMPVAVAVQAWTMSGNKPLREKYFTAAENTNAAMIQYIQGMPVIKAFNQTAESFKKYSESVRTCAHYEAAICDRWLLPTTLFSVSLNAGMLVLMPLGAAMYLAGSITLSTFVLFLLIALGLGSSLFQFIMLGSMLEKHLEGQGRIKRILNAAPLPEPATSKPAPDNRIVADNVEFSYGEKKVLRGIDFVLPAGNFLALVGPSGAGKTTLARLIPRFWDVENGAVRLGETDVRDMKMEDLMDKITFVFQDVFLFNDTIAENLRLGKPDATREELEAAAAAARCHDFIMSLPDGYDHIVGERGGKISGGEKQRLSIARALLKNAPILVMDEATAFIDPENEAIIQEAINSLVKDKTLIVIAHRLSTITAAHQILVIDRGEIAAEGTHEQLLEKNDLYRSMWEAHVSSRRWALESEAAASSSDMSGKTVG